MHGIAKLILQKFELLKAMNTIVKYMNDEDAYSRWILTVPDAADDDELMEIAGDEDDEIFGEACKEFRRIVNKYMPEGLFVGGYPNPGFVYGAIDDEEDEG